MTIFPEGYLGWWPQGAFPQTIPYVAPETVVWYEQGNDALTFPLALPLYRYAQIVEQDECAFWGVSSPLQEEAACGVIWTKAMRDRLARYLAQAEEMVVSQLGYPLVPMYIQDVQQVRSHLFEARYGYIIEVGAPANDLIEADVSVDHADDPAVVRLVAPDLTDVQSLAEFQLYYPGLGWNIWPSSISTDGDDVIFYVPRCRMVKPEYIDNPEAGWPHANLDYFLSTVDIRRVYTNTETQASLVGPHRCNVICSTSGCTEYSVDACLRVRASQIGALEIWPTTIANICRQRGFERANLYYRAGRWNRLTSLMESAIVRLAHTLMPNEPCRCDVISTMWKRDNDSPRWTTIERHNNPFGLSDGAWMAWQFVTQPGMRLTRMGVM